jgi:hypothetical protein
MRGFAPDRMLIFAYVLHHAVDDLRARAATGCEIDVACSSKARQFVPPARFPLAASTNNCYGSRNRSERSDGSTARPDCCGLPQEVTTGVKA